MQSLRNILLIDSQFHSIFWINSEILFLGRQGDGSVHSLRVQYLRAFGAKLSTI